MTTIDLATLVLYMCGVVLLSYVIGRKEKSAEDYHFGGKAFGSLLLIATLAATAMGASSVMGQAGAGYNNGVSTVWSMVIPWCIGWAFLIPMAKTIRRSGTTSFCNLMFKRFGRGCSKPISAFQFVASMSGIAVQVTGMGSLIKIMFPQVSYELAVTLATAVTVLYTSFGGIKAVIWTDVIQVIMLTIGLCVVIPIMVFVGIKHAGMDWTAVKLTLGANKLSFMGTYTFATLFPLIIRYMFAATCNTAYYQRIAIAKDEKAAQRSQAGGILSYLVLGSIIILTAMFISVIEPNNANPETVMTGYVIQHMPVVVRGLLIAAFFSAVMSSMDTFMLISAERFTMDIVEVEKRFPGNEKKQLMFSRLACAIIGVGGLLLSLVFKQVLAVMQYCTTITGASTFFPLVLGLYWKKATGEGMLAGTLVGGVIAIVLGIVKIPGLDATIIGNIGSLLSVILVSLATQKHTRLVGEHPGIWPAE